MSSDHLHQPAHVFGRQKATSSSTLPSAAASRNSKSAERTGAAREHRMDVEACTPHARQTRERAPYAACTARAGLAAGFKRACDGQHALFLIGCHLC